MNRRKLLASASTLALSGCSSAQQRDPKADTAKADSAMKPQEFFKSNLTLAHTQARPLTPHETYSEAQVATIMVIALHKTARGSIVSSTTPTGDLSGVDPAVYTKVNAYMTQHPGVVEPVLSAFQGVLQDITLFAAGSADDAGYTGPPEGCLGAANTKLITDALKTVRPA